MNTLSCHILDTASGHPAANIEVELYPLGAQDPIARMHTDDDGRARFENTTLAAGSYTLRFLVAPYCQRVFSNAFFPYVDVHFSVSDTRHLHIPLLLSPYAYSSYRGS